MQGNHNWNMTKRAESEGSSFNNSLTEPKEIPSSELKSATGGNERS